MTMTDYDRREHLKAVHASRKASTYQKVDEAIQRLQHGPHRASISIAWQVRWECQKQRCITIVHCESALNHYERSKRVLPHQNS